MNTFTMEYEFTSTSAYGDAFTRRLVITARNAQEAYNVARIEGFKAYGARFTDNCFDWRIVS